MKKTSSNRALTYLDHIRFWNKTEAHGSSTLATHSSNPSTLPINQKTSANIGSNGAIDLASNATITEHDNVRHLAATTSDTTCDPVGHNTTGNRSSVVTSLQETSERSVLTKADATANSKQNIAFRFYKTTKGIIFSSWINVLLVFVPVGIVADVAHLDPVIIFSMNAIAIIPLAGLLSHATESVARRMGDTIGALLNVTFGNAVELIIFIALVKNDIRIVQASLLGSILSNLLLILGMCFLVGGLRYREQVYNSTVTQMSACLLSLAVMSLLLPTAFHASFADTASASATTNVLRVSRGTSVILLLIYILYLIFQLKSHAYMYQSTPQHIIDEESAHPGPVAAWMDSSTSSSSSSSSSDSDDSDHSNGTASRIRRVMRAGRRPRKSSASKDTDDLEAVRNRPSTQQSAFINSVAVSSGGNGLAPTNCETAPSVDDHTAEDEADNEGPDRRGSGHETFHDRLSEKLEKKRTKKEKRAEKKERKYRRHQEKKRLAASATILETKDELNLTEKNSTTDQPRAVDFALGSDVERKGVLSASRNFRPAMAKTFSQNIFTAPLRTGSPQLPIGQSAGPIPRVRYGIRRTNSLPDRMNTSLAYATPYPTDLSPAGPPIVSHVNTKPEEEDDNISRTTAVILLLVSTALVAICAEFMVDSIQAVTSTTSLGETFVGLIILPIVGNAAEHVTAVTVAHKNKMDLAIGVAVGSSIQIALFVTPLIVLLGWIMDREMSLYFTLFETVSLFVSCFIVNFLVLDGRSNYLEGALLCAAYIIIAVAAFFYPTTAEQSVLGGKDAEVMVAVVKRAVGLI